jgi:hypothetical protein
MRKREVMEFRNFLKTLKPIHSSLEQATFCGSLIARFIEFNRNLRTWRALHRTTTEQERSCIFHKSGTEGESVKRGSNRTECRKSDEFILVKKGVKASGAKGLGRYRVIGELFSQIRG